MYHGLLTPTMVPLSEAQQRYLHHHSSHVEIITDSLEDERFLWRELMEVEQPLPPHADKQTSFHAWGRAAWRRGQPKLYQSNQAKHIFLFALRVV